MTRPTVEELEARVRETMEICDWEGFTAALTDLAARAKEAEEMGAKLGRILQILEEMEARFHYG